MCEAYQDLPDGWYAPKLSELGDICTGTTPPTSDPSNYGGDLPFIGPSDLGSKRWIDSCSVKLTRKGQLLSRTVEKNAVLVSCIGILGKIGQAKERLSFNQQVNSIQPAEGKVDTAFLYFSASRLQSELNKLAGLQVVPIVNKSLFSDLRILAPKRLQEQQLIARILDTLDTQIEQTEALIAKLEKVKEGLLHDLLTRGIDEDGQLRPSPEQAPELYKESPLGLIPREWEAMPLTGLIEDGSPITYGVVKPGERYDQNGALFIRGGDIKNGKITIENLRTIHKSVSRQYKRTILKGGEIVMSLVGYPGEVAIVPPELEEANIARQAALIRISKSHSSKFVITFLKSRAGKKQVLGSSLGSAQQVVNLSDLKNTLIPNPSNEEQEAISEAHDKYQILKDNAQLELEKLKLKKQSLMDDLLTGHVRVTPLLA
ncbi:restriction endonuclease subunit S [Cobetia amphilecti]|uniref:restriction endonuclease subunit S n=1 Tax=Cobetia amphilecti TaxID=1055104 RepID=UPI001C08FC30|nr:restriction endonuclease subunit S [Cobetia amphilecti]MBU3009536.1 restriction endonuclease subunit S [Cobetia amphilecti]